MKLFFKIAVLSCAMLSFAPAVSATSTQAFAGCMVDTLNGKERKSLAKWIFLSISAHPEISTYSNVTDKDKLDSDKYVGALITRLLTVDCPTELVNANKADPMAVQKAFELVGQVAMQELMSNEDTMRALTSYAQFTDQEKINSLLSQ